MKHHFTLKKSTLVLAAVTLLTSANLAWAADGEVYKSPSCGCCKLWVKHMQEQGFELAVHNVQNMQPVKLEAGIQPQYMSCHTAKIDGYVIEGHVPAEDVKRLLATRPQVKGIAVAGMPAGSPGMEQGDRTQPYQVLAFDEHGRTRVFSDHR